MTSTDVVMSTIRPIEPSDQEQEQALVLAGLVASDPKLTQNTRWVYRYWPTATTEAQTILPILLELKVNNLGIIYQKDAYGTSEFELLKTAFEKTGGAVIGEAFMMKESDYKTPVAKLIDSDAIFFVGFTFHVKNIFKQLKESNFKGFKITTHAAADDSIRNMPEADGAYCTVPIIFIPKFLYAAEAKKKLVDRYHRSFNFFAAANGYDFIRFFSNLLEDQKLSRSNARRLLDQGFTYPGVFGDIRLKPGEHDIHIPLHPARIENGKIKYR